MKKIILISASALFLILPSYVHAANKVIVEEDFEAYNLTAIYNSGELTVSYPGMSDATLTGAYIINAAGGIYEGDEVYEGNAAENIVAYAKTSDTTAIAVTGGLNNGWHGAYSHPMLYLEGGQGAASELNASNRRLAVVTDGGSKVLNLAPSTNSYVTTSSWYGYDDIDFLKPVVWETDVNVKQTASGEFTLSLTKGGFSKISPFKYASHESGRTNITPLVSFTPEGKITVGGTECGEYSTGVYYTVSVYIDADKPSYFVTVKERATGDTVVSQESTELDYDFYGITGIDYYSQTVKGASKSTEVKIDNISVAHVVFDAEIKSTAAVNINGKGVSVLEFSDSFDKETVNTDNIKVYNEDELVEGVELSVANTKRVRLSFPELEPTAVYTVKVKGVKSLEGISADCVTSFKTKDIVSLSSVKRSADGVNYAVKNNANREIVLTVLAAGYCDGKIVSDGVHYKRLTIGAGETVNGELTQISFSDTPDSIKLYIIDSISGFRAAAPEVSAE